MDFSYENLEDLITKAEKGDSGAQVDLGLFYLSKGRNTGGGDEPALYWFERAASQGCPSGAMNLGSCYYNGQGTRKDMLKAIIWWRKAAEMGSAPAQFNLGRFHETGQYLELDEAKALYWYGKAAELGHVNAQALLGDFFMNGRGMARPDPKQGAYWWLKAAMLGNYEAQYNLGVCFSSGSGVTKDPIEAYAWFSLAAQHMEKAQDARDTWGSYIGVNKLMMGVARAQALLREIEQRVSESDI